MGIFKHCWRDEDSEQPSWRSVCCNILKDRNNSASRNLLRRPHRDRKLLAVIIKKLDTSNKLPLICLTEHHDPLIGMWSIKISMICSEVRKTTHIVWSHWAFSQNGESSGQMNSKWKPRVRLGEKAGFRGIEQSNVIIFLLSIANFFSFLAKTK